MQRRWRRSWERYKIDFMRLRSVSQERVTIKKMTSSLVKKILPPVAAASILMGSMTGVYANPAGGQVITGSGTITQNGKTMTVKQSTDKLGINWQSFNIGAGEKVQFIQPGVNSVALNRIVGNNPSAIYGTLSANGKVFLVNPNGILFAPGAQVNVGGLVASTLNISDADFRSGEYKFSGNGRSVINQGNITTENDGYVALLGFQVKNEGIIVANKGAVALGAGSAATLDMNGDGLLNLAVNQGEVQALAENKNLIQADGGQVIMTASAADSLAGTVVNNSGVIQARSASKINGVIRLDGGTNGIVSNSGTMDTSGKNAGEIGGTIKVLGSKVELTGQAKIDASGTNGGGTILIGGNYQGSGSEQNATNTSVSKDVIINADAAEQGNGGKVVIWANGLTTYEGTISARGGTNSGDGGNAEVSGKQKLVYKGFTDLRSPKGKTGILLLDPADYTIASSNGDITGAALSSQIDSANVNIILSSDGTHGGTNGDINVNDDIIWNSNNSLTLSAYHDININSNITNTHSTGAAIKLRADNTGIDSGKVNFASGKAITSNGQVSIYYNPSGTFSSTINGTSVTTKNYTSPTDYSSNVLEYTGGGSGDVTSYMLVNDLNQLQAMNTNLAGNYALGRNIEASTTVNWNGGAGFIPIGWSWDAINPFKGNFDGGGHVISGLTINRTDPTQGGSGLGLFGIAQSANISNVGLENVSVNGFETVGGLVGLMALGNVSNVYSTGVVRAENNSAGGLVGVLSSSNLNNAYSNCQISLGPSSSGGSAGGLIGQFNSGTINEVYSTGRVNGTGTNIGGLIGIATMYYVDSIRNSYWDKDTSYQSKGIGYAFDQYNTISVTGLSADTLNPLSQASYSGFDFINTWRINEGRSYPSLSVFSSAPSATLIPLTITANSISKTYDGLAYTAFPGVTYSLTPTTHLQGTLVLSGTWYGAVNADEYTIIPSGLASNNYAITYVSGKLTINKAPLTISAINDTKVYDGTGYYGCRVAYRGFVNGESETTNSVLSGTLRNIGDSNGAVDAGRYSIIHDGYTSPNYDIRYEAGTLTIDKAPLIVKANNSSKLFGTSDYKPKLSVSCEGLKNNDTPSVLEGNLTFTAKEQHANGLSYSTDWTIPPIPQGHYLLIPGGVEAKNYNITYVAGTLDITLPIQPTAINEGYIVAISSAKQGINWVPLLNNSIGLFGDALKVSVLIETGGLLSLATAPTIMMTANDVLRHISGIADAVNGGSGKGIDIFKTGAESFGPVGAAAWDTYSSLNSFSGAATKFEQVSEGITMLDESIIIDTRIFKPVTQLGVQAYSVVYGSAK